MPFFGTQGFVLVLEPTFIGPWVQGLFVTHILNSSIFVYLNTSMAGTPSPKRMPCRWGGWLFYGMQCFVLVRKCRDYPYGNVSTKYLV